MKRLFIWLFGNEWAFRIMTATVSSIPFILLEPSLKPAIVFFCTYIGIGIAFDVLKIKERLMKR